MKSAVHFAKTHRGRSWGTPESGIWKSVNCGAGHCGQGARGGCTRMPPQGVRRQPRNYPSLTRARKVRSSTRNQLYIPGSETTSMGSNLTERGAPLDRRETTTPLCWDAWRSPDSLLDTRHGEPREQSLLMMEKTPCRLLLRHPQPAPAEKRSVRRWAPFCSWWASE